MRGIDEALASLERLERTILEGDRAERLALDAAPWPRWRCRFGWHRRVLVREGEVTGLGHVLRYACGGRCGAWWLEDMLGGPDRQDR